MKNFMEWKFFFWINHYGKFQLVFFGISWWFGAKWGESYWFRLFFCLFIYLYEIFYWNLQKIVDLPYGAYKQSDF